ncbi:MAG: hypothetical protein IPM99_18950 [Rubrivivax sp.]|nr:hypothetical protein [Rubrivivax sp.]
MRPAATLCPDVRIVPEHIARNPIARAMAKAAMTSAVRDFVTRIYMMRDGEDAAADGTASARVLAIGIRLTEQRGQQHGAACRVMRGGMESIVGLAQRRWKWRSADARAIDVALHHALDAVRTARAHELNAAWHFVQQLEQQAAQPHQPTEGPTP